MATVGLVGLLAACGPAGSNNGSNNGTNNGSNNGSGDCTKIESMHISEDTEWSAACYEVDGKVDVDNGVLTIAAGTTLTFTQDSLLRINADGKLTAVGTKEEPITFEGAEDTAGFWAGIEFWGTNSVDNKLDYVTITGAGSRGGDYIGHAAGIILNLTSSGSDKTRVSIDHTHIEKSGIGLTMDHGSILDSFEENELTGNDMPVVSLALDPLQYLSASSTYTGNDTDVVLVDKGARGTKGEQTWHKLDVPYRLKSNLDVDNGLLTIEAGTTIEFNQSTDLTVNKDGQLTAKGTPDEKITFKGVESTAGYWNFVQFWGTTSTNNVLENVVVDGAGGAGCDYHGGQPSALCVNDTSNTPASATFNSVEVTNNGGDYTILITDNSSVSACDITTDGGTVTVYPDTNTCPTM